MIKNNIRRKPSQGFIVLIPFPFTDLSSTKIRPALVISNGLLRGDDLILCAITSQHSGIHEIELPGASLEKGALPLKSYVRTGKIVSLQRKTIRGIVAKVHKQKLKEVLSEIKSVLELQKL